MKRTIEESIRLNQQLIKELESEELKLKSFLIQLAEIKRLSQKAKFYWSRGECDKATETEKLLAEKQHLYNEDSLTQFLFSK